MIQVGRRCWRKSARSLCGSLKQGGLLVLPRAALRDPLTQDGFLKAPLAADADGGDIFGPCLVTESDGVKPEERSRFARGE